MDLPEHFMFLDVSKELTLFKTGLQVRDCASLARVHINISADVPDAWFKETLGLSWKSLLPQVSWNHKY